ncbi:MAG: hypothetical protein U1E56_00985 [Bauldia sp.]
MLKLTPTLPLVALLALTAVPTLTTAAPMRPAALADLGVPVVEPSDAMALVPFATNLSGSEKTDVETRCGVLLSNPVGYPADAVTYCASFKLAETLAPRSPADEDTTTQN